MENQNADSEDAMPLVSLTPFFLLLLNTSQIDMFYANRTNFQNGEHVFRRSILVNALKVRLAVTGSFLLIKKRIGRFLFFRIALAS